MKKNILLLVFSFLGMVAFAAFPVEVQNLLIDAGTDRFKLNTTAFLLGILTCWLLPYSVLLLFIKKKNFRGSLAWGWLAGWVLVLLIALLIFVAPEFMFLY